MLKCVDLLCEYRENPVGLDVSNPRFCWKIEGDGQNVLQTAYEIKVGDIWSSGRVESGACIHICYEGTKLKPMTRYTWTVRVWDNRGEISEWTEGYFETGLMDLGWEAQWITMRAEEKPPQCPVFRKTFALEKIPKSARIYATALGNYEVTMNGTRVGDQWLAPGFTSYNKHLLYQTYDVTELLAKENELRVTVANGWHMSRLAGRVNVFGGKHAILLQLCAVDEDGKNVLAATDDSWEYGDSPTLVSEIYDGETYDAALEPDCYRNWRPVELWNYPKSHIVAQAHEPVRITHQVKPVEMIRTPKGETVIDFGQNMVGWAAFKVSGNKGDKVILSHAEVLDKEGNFYTENMRSAKNHVEYRLKGEGEEEFHPHFTFQGFRYIRVDAFPGEVTLDSFTGLVIHSDFKRTGRFACSNPEINRLFENVIWGQRGNFVDVPTDCPQRDERLGWTGDAQVFVKTAALNYRVTAFFEKWLTDLRLDQSKEFGVSDVVPHIFIDQMPENVHNRPRFENSFRQSSAWGDAATICPWEIYRAFGDVRILENQFDSMCDWVEYIRAQGEDEFLWNTGRHYGDWLGLDAAEGSYVGRTAKDYIATVFYAHSAHLTAKAARVLGRTAEAEKYEALYHGIKKAFQREFVTPNGRLTEDTQTGYVLALYFDMVDNKERAINRLAQLVEENDNKLTTGFVGTPYLCHALTENGRVDLAYSLVLQTEYPSWLYSVRQGATTIWEHWDGIKPDGSFWSVRMNSYNHYAYGAVADWMYTKAAGIHYDEQQPGYRHMVIRPMTDPRLKFVRAELETMYGKVVSAWEYQGNQLRFHVEIPANTTAEFVYPDGRREQLGSGVYDIEPVE